MLCRRIRDGVCTVEDEAVSFSCQVDVIVAGVGTAGAMSALCAARDGLSVLALDRAVVTGGVPVASGVWAYYLGGEQTGTTRDINAGAQELVDFAGFAGYQKVAFETEAVCIPSAPKGQALERALMEAGCTLWLDCEILGVYIQENRIAGLEILKEGAVISVGCRSIIDSADGFVCRMAGCRITRGRRSDGKTMRFSKCIAHSAGLSVRPVWLNYGYADEQEPEAYSKKLLEVCSDALYARSTYDEKTAVVFDESILARREICSVETWQTVTLAGLLDGQTTAEPLFFSFSHLDNSNPDLWLEDEEVQDFQTLIQPNNIAFSIPIDKGCLISREYENLFVAGKHIGVGHGLVGCIRMKADMERCGEAAAVLAKRYVRKEPMETGTVREELIERGAAARRRPPDYAFIRSDRYVPVTLPETSDSLKNILASSAPQLGLLQARLNRGNTALAAQLTHFLKENNVILRDNAAVALGLMGDPGCLPYLRDILCRPAYVLTHAEGEKNSYPWIDRVSHCNTVKALCLLQRFKDAVGKTAAQAILADEGCNVSRELSEEEKAAFLPAILGYARHWCR